MDWLSFARGRTADCNSYCSTAGAYRLLSHRLRLMLSLCVATYAIMAELDNSASKTGSISHCRKCFTVPARKKTGLPRRTVGGAK